MRPTIPPPTTGHRKPTNPLVAAVVTAVVIVGAWPQAARAQARDSLRSDTLTSFPSGFRLNGIQVVAGRRLTATGGVGVVEMRLDSLGSLPILSGKGPG